MSALTIPTAELLRVAIGHCLARAGLDRPGHRYRGKVELHPEDGVVRLRHVGSVAASTITVPADSTARAGVTIELLALHKTLAASKQESVSLTINHSHLSIAYGSVTATIPYETGTVPPSPILTDDPIADVVVPHPELLPVLAQWVLADRSGRPTLHLQWAGNTQIIWAAHRTGVMCAQAEDGCTSPTSDIASTVALSASCWAGWRTSTICTVYPAHAILSTSVPVKHGNVTLMARIEMTVPTSEITLPQVEPLMTVSGIERTGPREKLLHAVRAVSTLTEKALRAVTIHVHGNGTATITATNARKTQQAAATCSVCGPEGLVTLHAGQLTTILSHFPGADVQWHVLPQGPVRFSTLDGEVMAVVAPVTP